MANLLDALRFGPDVEVALLRDRLEWDQARAWGWVMETGELTGTGLAHAQTLPRGMIE